MQSGAGREQGSLSGLGNGFALWERRLAPERTLYISSRATNGYEENTARMLLITASTRSAQLQPHRDDTPESSYGGGNTQMRLWRGVSRSELQSDPVAAMHRLELSSAPC